MMQVLETLIALGVLAGIIRLIVWWSVWSANYLYSPKPRTVVNVIRDWDGGCAR